MTVPRRSFEALLQSLALSSPHRQAIQALGLDLDSLQDDYPVSLWHRVLEISREHVFPELPAEQAYWEMGRRCVAGLAQTVVGQVVAASMVGITPEGFIRRIPAMVPFGRPGVTMDVWAEGARRWRSRITDPAGIPEFTAGVIDGALERNKLQVQVRLDRLVTGGYELLFTW
jgi:uncharacterized protein (TIGR02265 family)